MITSLLYIYSMLMVPIEGPLALFSTRISAKMLSIDTKTL